MPQLTPDSCELLYRLASDCRQKQKAYFETRKKSDMKTAIAAESILDALLLKYTSDAQQTLPGTDEAEPESEPTFPGFEEG